VPHALSPSNERFRWEVRGKPNLLSLPADPTIFQPSSAWSQHNLCPLPGHKTSPRCMEVAEERSISSAVSGEEGKEASRQRQRGSLLRKVG